MLTFVYHAYDDPTKMLYKDAYGDESFLGLRAEIIIFRKDHPFMQREGAEQWINEYVRCRLETGGRWIDVEHD